MNIQKFIFTSFVTIGYALLAGNMVVAANETTSTSTLTSDNQTVQEEAEGKALWNKLQAKQTTCSNLSNDDFELMGEYFMGQMTGSSHQAMNTMMEQTMGKSGEEQMHQVMGKRLSSCDTSAAWPAAGASLMPMMNMMMAGGMMGMSGRKTPFGTNQLTNPMMNFGFGSWSWFGWIFMILWWVLIITAIVALIKWLTGQSGGGRAPGKTALEILKERYARGEIDKKEFEEKKKDLA